jgi:hypothetical protein
LASLIPKTSRCKEIDASKMDWVRKSETFFKTWEKVAPCMAQYEAFLKAHKDVSQGPASLGQGFQRDVRAMQAAQMGKAMNPAAEVALGEFYLSVALRLRPHEIDAAGSDSKALLNVARSCAEEEFEPFIEDARALVSDYDASMHMALEDTCPLYEVDEGLFWRANFDVTSAAEFQHFITALGHGSGQGNVLERAHTSPSHVPEAVKRASEGLNGNDASFEPARRAARLVYEKWLEASSMPVKANIIQALMEHGFLVGKDIHSSEALLPEVFPSP